MATATIPKPGASAAPRPAAIPAAAVKRPVTTAPAAARVTAPTPVAARVPAGTAPPVRTAAPVAPTSWWQGDLWGIPVWMLVLVALGVGGWFVWRKLPKW